MFIWKRGWSSLSIFFKDLFYLCYVRVGMCTYVGVSTDSRKGVRSPKAKVVGHCEPPTVGAGTELRSSERVANALGLGLFSSTGHPYFQDDSVGRSAVDCVV